jgi:hypothetical protein
LIVGGYTTPLPPRKLEWGRGGLIPPLKQHQQVNGLVNERRSSCECPKPLL